MKVVKSVKILIILIIFSSCVQKKTEVIKKQPNIVIIYLDDLGYGDLSSYGATELNTPNIDALANEGVRFTNGYATSATCTPSRYGLLTGVYPWQEYVLQTDMQHLQPAHQVDMVC